MSTTKWILDADHCEIAFKVRHLMIAHVKGRFKKFDASIETKGDDFTTAVIRMSIDVASIDTGSEKRDEHLRSADFFDVAQHKEITFTSDSMSAPDAQGNSELSGNLTIKGITHPFTFKVQAGGTATDPSTKKEKAGFMVSGKFKRSDWDLHWDMPAGNSGLVIGQEIGILCDIEIIKAVE